MVRSFEEPKQLSTIQDLKENGFGQPHPRHGLRLLYWFATECVEFNEHGNMLLQCNPKEDFGFHYFSNIEKILPDLSGCMEQYFEVGNLTYHKAEDLPNYVREYSQSQCNKDRIISQSQCNKDRIIIRQKQGNVQDVMATYVTEHKQGGRRGEFDAKRTHLVNPDLIRMIRDAAGLKKFLDQTKMDVIPLEFDSEHSKRSRPDQTTWDNSVRTLLDPEQDVTMSPPGLSLRKRCSRSCKVFSVVLVVSLVITLTVLAILGKL
uniref:uncharacterized protein LOC124001515 isoform X2 n=1 Tax=Oncorhynchus gorbuscha TaxID=8017 RepID=UPI001EAF0F8E|nr:uncharacterized protein LOC124001515 isoform X2 [Oncorhynchus gorbuscha]